MNLSVYSHDARRLGDRDPLLRLYDSAEGVADPFVVDAHSAYNGRRVQAQRHTEPGLDVPRDSLSQWLLRRADSGYNVVPPLATRPIMQERDGWVQDGPHVRRLVPGARWVAAEFAFAIGTAVTLPNRTGNALEEAHHRLDALALPPSWLVDHGYGHGIGAWWVFATALDLREADHRPRWEAARHALAAALEADPDPLRLRWPGTSCYADSYPPTVASYVEEHRRRDRGHRYTLVELEAAVGL